MKVKQIRVSGSVAPFREKMMSKYNLLEYNDKNSPAVFFGLYNDTDYTAAESHKSHIIVVWCGTDALKLEKFKDRVKKLKNVVHIAMSEFISNTLNKYGIKHKILPITPTKLIKNRKDRGNKVYFYTSKTDRLKYGGDLLEEVKKRIPFEVVEGYHGKFNKEELEKVYEDTFIGLRLTKHDGLPNTVVELGLMGRKCVYNGNLTNSLPYKNIDDIVNHIFFEYKNRMNDNTDIVDNIYDELTIDDSWLNLNTDDFKTKVTVIMNSYQESESNFRRAVESVLNNKDVKIQLIVSTVKGDMCEIWSKDYELELVINEKPGIYEQINATTPKISGDFICYASSNDIMYDYKLKKESDLLILQNKEICYSNYDILNLIDNTQIYKELGDYSYEKHLVGNFVSDCAMISKKIFNEFTPFKVEYKNHAFYDFWLRVYEKYGDVFINNKQTTWKYIVTKDSSHYKRKFDQKKDRENKNLKKQLVKDRVKTLKDIKLSIIIPTFNNTEYIDECVNSILESCKIFNVEILVGIDGCEKTLNQIKQKTYPDFVKFYYFKSNNGPYDIKNTLTQISNSENLLFFDSDDIIIKTTISEIINNLKSYDLIRLKYNEIKDGKTFDKSNFGEGVFAIKKSVFLSMNGFEPWKVAADSDFMGRIYKKRPKIYHTKNIAFYRRLHSQSLTKRPDTGMSSSLRATYAKTSKNKKGDGNPDRLYIRDFVFVDINTIVVDTKNHEFYNHRKSQLDKVLNPAPRKVVGGITVKKDPVINDRTDLLYSNPKPLVRTIKPNKPDNRQELINLKNNTNKSIHKQLFNTKPERRTGINHITIGGKSKM